MASNNKNKISPATAPDTNTLPGITSHRAGNEAAASKAYNKDHDDLIRQE